MPLLKRDEIFAGRYRLVGQVGNGGFSEVWKAADTMTEDTVVALKVYVPDRGLDSSGIQLFRKEYALTQHLGRHPYLLIANHFDVVDGSPYLVLPFCEQGSLTRQLMEKGNFTEEEVARVIIQIAGALAHLHRQQPPVLHQDIKPDNVLVSAHGEYLLADFGISDRTRNTLKKSTTKAVSMTLAYAPPEKFSSQPQNTPAGDVFSLGVMLYELCTGDVPWMGSGGAALLRGGERPHLPKSYAQRLDTLIRACMSVEPGERPTAAELEKYARLYLDRGYWPTAQEIEKQDRESKKLSKTVVAVLIGVAILLLVGIGVYFWPHPPPEPEPKPDNGKAAQVEKTPSENFTALQASLNKLSNTDLPDKERAAQLKTVLAYFVNDQAEVNLVSEKNGASYDQIPIKQFSGDLLYQPKSSITVDRVEKVGDKIGKIYLIKQEVK